MRKFLFLLSEYPPHLGATLNCTRRTDLTTPASSLLMRSHYSCLLTTHAFLLLHTFLLGVVQIPLLSELGGMDAPVDGGGVDAGAEMIFRLPPRWFVLQKRSSRSHVAGRLQFALNWGGSG